MGSGFQKPAFEMSEGEILRSSINLYRAQPLDLIAPIFVSSLVSELLRKLVGGPSFSLTWMAAMIASEALSAIAEGSVIRYASEELEGRVPALKDAIYSALSKLVPLAVAGIIILLLVLIGGILLVVPGILIGIILSLTAPLIVIEQVGAIDAMKRSRNLTEGRWTRIFALMLLLFIVGFLVALPTFVLFVIEVLVLRFALATATTSLPFVTLSFLSSVLVGPLRGISLTYLYYSLKVKGVAKPEVLPPPPPP